MEGEGHNKEVALLNSIRVYKNRYPIYDQDGGKMAKIDTLFMTKTYLYSPYKGVTPPGEKQVRQL